MFKNDFTASVQSRLSKPETMLIITFQMIFFKRRGSVKRPWSKHCGNNFSEAVFKRKFVTFLMDGPH